jgi:hypothetical protein
MWVSEKHIWVIGAIYLAIAFFTFGNSFNRYDCEKIENTYQNADCHERQGIESIGSALFWPFYWSIRLQESRS